MFSASARNIWDEMPTYYHADRTNSLKEGSQLTLQFSRGALPAMTNRSEAYLTMFEGGVSAHGYNYLLRDGRPNPNSDSDGIMEMLLEYLRRVHYPIRPSRYQSLFAVQSVEQAVSFAESHPPEGLTDTYRYSVWEVEGQGSEFIADSQWLSWGECWTEVLVRFHYYWRGIATNDPKPEVLIPLPVTVGRCVLPSMAARTLRDG